MGITETDHSKTRIINSYEMVTYFVREVFGTYFIEEGSWSFGDGNAIIGRTYFSDRKRYKAAINGKTVENIVQLYNMALSGKSTYKVETISQNIAQMFKDHLGFNIDYLMFYDDDTSLLHNRKIQMICHLSMMILRQVIGKEHITWDNLYTVSCLIHSKTLAFIIGFSRGTFTETVLQYTIDNDPGYEVIRSRYISYNEDK